MRLRFAAPTLALLALVACNDSRNPTEVRGPSAVRRIIAPSGTLDQNITTLLDMFPKGTATAGRNRWGNVKAKYQEGLTSPEQMKVAKKMLYELAQWLKAKAPEMSPTGGETIDAASARLTLYMSLYIYEGPAASPPVYTPTADNTVALVSPTEAATVVTPEEQAGVSLEAGSVAEETIIVITENPTPYPTNCSGPLQTKLCQYPRFFHFNQFPHERLLKAGKFVVCHVNEGTERTPLADHDRFRLAHTKPVDPADYTPGSTIRDQNGENIEILPLIWNTAVLCDDIQYSLNPSTGMTGALTRLASKVGKLVSPKKAYAIDQGGGGLSLMFSDFNDVDPESQPDDSVTMTTSADTAHGNDHVEVNYSVVNRGTATAPPSAAAIAFNTGMPSPSVMILGSNPLPAMAPGDSLAFSTEVVIPPAMTGSNYSLSVSVSQDPTFPDSNLVDNTAARPLAIDPAFVSIVRRWNFAEASQCALNASNATYCWADNTHWEYGSSGALQSSPFAPTPLQLAFVQLAQGPPAHHFCGIKADRSAICWGRGGFGQLGRGTQGNFTNPPAAVSGGISWAEITTSRLSSCGVSTTGVGYCWGSNQRGEVGRASMPIGAAPAGNTLATMTLAPAVIDGGHIWKSVVAGWLHACGITTAGAAYCWGDNSRGQLGLGVPDNDTTHRSPAPVVGGLTFIQLSLSATHTCGITADHKAYCWGENFTGQVGNGATVDVGAPVQVGAPMRFSYIATGSNFAVGGNVAPPPAGQASVGHTCALSESGAAWCWGWNAAGQLGNGTTVGSGIPVPVAGGLRFTSLSLGGAASCGRRGNRIWCWGGNEFGQLGIGTLTNTSSPVLVGSPFNVP